MCGREVGSHFAPTCLNATRVAHIRFLDMLTLIALSPVQLFAIVPVGMGFGQQMPSSTFAGYNVVRLPPTGQAHARGGPTLSAVALRAVRCRCCLPLLRRMGIGVNERGWRRLCRPSSLASCPSSCLPAARELAAQRRHGSGLVEQFVLCARRCGSLENAVLRLPRLSQRPIC